jgi:glycerophosphoryl diester phosphodiesterase
MQGKNFPCGPSAKAVGTRLYLAHTTNEPMRFLPTIFLLFIAFAVSAQPSTLDVQGHRGSRGLMPENTIPAFLKALELGVTTLELDVVISKDKQVVVSHEPYFNSVFSIKPDGQPVTKSEEKSLNLYKLIYADIKRYDVGSNGNPAFPEQQKMKAVKPLLSEVIREAEAWCKAHNRPAVHYNIELKSERSEYNKSQPEPAAFCALVYTVINQQLPPERVVIQSFDFAVLQAWEKQTDVSAGASVGANASATGGLFKKMRLAALVENMKSVETNVANLGFIPAIYSPYFQLLTAEKIKRIHELGMQVIPWTVNKRDDMERLRDQGVDGIITDYPDRAKGL